MGLQHGILGFLNYGPCSGYELTKAFHSSVQFFWPAQTSQIYLTLGKLENAGLVTHETVIQNGKPNKNVYSILPAGRAELQRWLSEQGKTADGYKSEFLMKVFFAENLPPQQAITMLRAYADGCRAWLRSMDSVPQSIEDYGKLTDASAPVYWAFTAQFGSDVAMLHSALPLTERYDQWKRIRRGEVRVVLGTRSAVFAPLQNLGLIILDEEQETSYQSENPPRYHARDVAQFRCAQNDALLLLGSATPTIETAYAAKNGRYQVFSLHKRFNDLPLPKVLIADMKDELRQGNETSIGHALRAELEKNIERGEQSILFLNRRGSARMLLCGECGYVPQCPRCSVPMTYHSANERLMCHYCGHSEAVVDRCSECGGLMKRVGSGTQKVEQELFDLFPKAKVLRMDADTVGASRGHEALLREFEEKNIPILLGTQMVAKGLDFENVTLVGVLDADLSLYVQNYHAAERTYSLLAQVVGRAGRGERPGRAGIQTYHPENEVIQAAAKQDYETFYQNELRMRSLRRYPPFADLFTLTVSGLDELRVIAAARALCDALRYASSQPPLSGLDVEVLGPAGAPVVKVNNRYRYCVYLCGKGGSVLRRTVSEYLLAFYARKENRGLDIFADCNALQ